MPTYIEGFVIDAVLQEDRVVEADITDHPVEQGVSITDHVRIKPMTLSMECLVSDTPTGRLLEDRVIQVGDVELSAGTNGDFVASDVARAFILRLQRLRKPITVSTSWKRTDGSEGYMAYDNMLIQSVSETINPETGDSTSLKVALKQVTFVTNERTVVKVAVPRASKKSEKGNKANEEGKETPKEQVTGFGKIVSLFQGRGDQTEIGAGVEGYLTDFGKGLTGH